MKSRLESEGIMNVIPSLHFPFNIWLEVSSVIRVLQQDGAASLSLSQNEIV